MMLAQDDGIFNSALWATEADEICFDSYSQALCDWLGSVKDMSDWLGSIKGMPDWLGPVSPWYRITAPVQGGTV